MICVLAAALALVPVDGLYIRETRFIPAMSIDKAKAVFGVEDYKTRSEYGMAYGWDLKEGAHLNIQVDRAGSIRSATVSINIGDKAPKRDIYALHTYTGKTRKVFLGKTTMKSVREWFGNGYKGLKSEKPVARPPDVLEDTLDGRELYGWKYEFGLQGECTLEFLTTFWAKDLTKPQQWRDGLPVRELVMKAGE